MSAPDYDVAIVGSGFGGSVMAYRLAEAGLRVCVLERGKAYPPGSFPRSPWRMRTNFWDPSEGLHGLFNIWSFRGLGAVVSSGLGGGSLIYANVLLRKPPETFQQEGWPVSYDDLAGHYENAEQMLGAQRYPFQPDPAQRTPDHEPYNRTPKTAAMQLAAQRLAAQGRPVQWELPNLAVTFANPDQPPVPGEPITGAVPNMFGRTRLTCRMCGECDVGCNYGSKNTLDYTYLSAALLASTPATIKTRAEVRELAPRDGGYVVRYVDHSGAPDGRKPDTPTSDLPIKTLTAKYLVLSAGAVGSTFLLLKNQDNFPGIDQAALGSRFCGNGDLLSFLVKCVDDESGTRMPRVLDGGYGPVITSAIRFTDSQDGQPRGYYYIEDAGYPEFVNWIVETGNQLALLRRGIRLARHLVRRWLRFDTDSDIGAEIAEFLGSCVLSSSSMPLLAMGRDTPDGRMCLTSRGRLDVDWRLSGSAPYFKRVRASAREIARVLRADFQENPLAYLSRVITVHPLGGCPMGRTPQDGVVDSYGRVFNHPGFYIADGSVVPGPVGPNPSLTIAALADRFADQLIAEANRG